MSAEPNRYVLDSFALLAYLEAEPGWLRVKAVLAEAAQERAEVYLSIINYGEVVYITERERGLPTAHEVIATLDRLSITLVQMDLLKMGRFISISPPNRKVINSWRAFFASSAIGRGRDGAACAPVPTLSRACQALCVAKASP